MRSFNLTWTEKGRIEIFENFFIKLEVFKLILRGLQFKDDVISFRTYFLLI